MHQVSKAPGGVEHIAGRQEATGGEPRAGARMGVGEIRQTCVRSERVRGACARLARISSGLAQLPSPLPTSCVVADIKHLPDVAEEPPGWFLCIFSTLSVVYNAPYIRRPCIPLLHQRPRDANKPLTRVTESKLLDKSSLNILNCLHY